MVTSVFDNTTSCNTGLRSDKNFLPITVSCPIWIWLSKITCTNNGRICNSSVYCAKITYFYIIFYNYISYGKHFSETFSIFVVIKASPPKTVPAWITQLLPISFCHQYNYIRENHTIIPNFHIISDDYRRMNFTIFANGKILTCGFKKFEYLGKMVVDFIKISERIIRN